MFTRRVLSPIQAQFCLVELSCGLTVLVEPSCGLTGVLRGWVRTEIVSAESDQVEAKVAMYCTQQTTKSQRQFVRYETPSSNAHGKVLVVYGPSE